MPNLIVLSGSIRNESGNAFLAKQLVAVAANLNASSRYLDLAEYPLPIYNGDQEQAEGLPGNVVLLKQLLSEADGLIITSPEYNGYLTPLLINTIDWCTRSDAASLDLNCFMDKPVFIASASPGSGGGARSAGHLKTMLSGIGAFVSPFPLTLPTSHKAFTESGDFVDEAMLARATAMLTKFVSLVGKLS